MKGITYIQTFISNDVDLFNLLKTEVDWDRSMSSRHTASFGKSYDYSQIKYPFQEFIPELKIIVDQISSTLGFEPNNCLINYYFDGKSKMGYHSDQTDILFDGTGVAIVSIGATRVLRFRNISDREIKKDFPLFSGSLIYMTNEIQLEWQHSIPKSSVSEGRMSLTFRRIK